MDREASSLVRVAFDPIGAVVYVPPGTPLREAAALAGVAIAYPCGGQGHCGKCLVHITGDGGPITATEQAIIGHEAAQTDCRLACHVTVHATISVQVSEASLQSAVQPILVDIAPLTPAVDPPIRTCAFSIQEPTLLDDAADAERLQQAIGSLAIDLDMFRAIPQRLRSGHWKGCAVSAENRLIEIVSDVDSVPAYVLAVDVGTTTLAATLIDPATGHRIANATRINPQATYGADVLTRISYAGQSEANTQRLRDALVAALNDLIADCAWAAAIDPRTIYAAAFAGNTTMQHSLAGLDTSGIGASPFVPVTREPLEVPAKLLGLSIHPRAHCYFFPVISGYVGGDTVAGILATQFGEGRTPALFIDIGTNGEMAVRNNGALTGTSCAAGPAFEGAGITHGMRAAEGAIEAVHLDGDVYIKTIGGKPAIGICGSGLIDLVAELLRTGLLDCGGQLLPSESALLRHRVCLVDGEPAFVVADESATQIGRPILLFQRDIRQLQLAVAAVRSGIHILLHSAGLEAGDLQTVLLAGAFGNYIRPANAQRIGLLPHTIPTDAIQFAGNTSLAGAAMAAMSMGARTEAQRLAQSTSHIDLSLNPDFHEIFTEYLFFPE